MMELKNKATKRRKGVEHEHPRLATMHQVMTKLSYLRTTLPKLIWEKVPTKIILPLRKPNNEIIQKDSLYVATTANPLGHQVHLQ